MNTTQEHIDKAFKLISAVSVSGDGVEIMAAAKQSLREAYNAAGKKDAKDKAEEVTDNGNG